MKKLEKNLKSLLEKEKFLVDIFLFGSALRSKEKPRDIDIIALVRGKEYDKTEDIIYSIKKIGDNLGMNMHIEPLIVDSLHKENIYQSILHEGFSIRNMSYIRELIRFKSYSMFSYSLKNKKNSEKVRFSYALYGRRKSKGLLKDIKGEEVGKAAVLAPIEKQEILKDFFKKWDVKFEERKVFIFE